MITYSPRAILGRCSVLVVVSIVIAWAALSALTLACEDRDTDGYYAASGCGTPVDCNDYDYTVRPGAEETCDSLDNDCDGSIDEECVRTCLNPERRFGGGAVAGTGEEHQVEPDLARSRYGYGVSWAHVPDSNNCYQVALAHLTDSGEPWHVVAGVSGIPGLSRAGRNTHTIWTGKDYFVAWAEQAADENCEGKGAIHAFLARIGPAGEILNGPTQISCTSAVGHGNAVPLDITWTGENVVVLWAQGDLYPAEMEGWYLSRFSANGRQLDPCGIRVFPGGPIQGGGVAWNGTHLGMYLITYPGDGGDQELYFSRFTSDLAPADLEFNRLTNNGQRSASADLVASGTGWGLAWSEEFVDASFEVAFAELTSGGEIQTPPGIVRVTWGADEPGGTNHVDPAITWNGSEYGISYSDHNNVLGTGDIRFVAVSPEGEPTTPDILVTTDTLKNALFSNTVWDGRDYAVVWQDVHGGSGQVQAHFGKVGCNCTNLDGDQFSSCAGNDCNDIDPLVNILQPEMCGNLIDDNCDGLADCQDVVSCPPLGSLAGPVEGLEYGSDKITATWQPAVGASRYDAARGGLRDLHYSRDARFADCLNSDLSGLSFIDTVEPAATDGFFYIVRAEGGAAGSCAASPWETADDSAVKACP